MALLRERVRSLTCTRASATRYPTPWMLPLILKSRALPRTLMIRRSPMLPRTLAGQRVRANRREQALCLREPAIAYPFFRWPSPPLPRWWLRYWRDLAAVNGCSAPCRIRCAWSRQCCSLGSALRRPCCGQGRPPCPRLGERTSVLRMNRGWKDVRPGCRRDLGVMVYGCGERTSVSPLFTYRLPIYTGCYIMVASKEKAREPLGFAGFRNLKVCYEVGIAVIRLLSRPAFRRLRRSCR